MLRAFVHTCVCRRSRNETCVHACIHAYDPTAAAGASADRQCACMHAYPAHACVFATPCLGRSQLAGRQCACLHAFTCACLRALLRVLRQISQKFALSVCLFVHSCVLDVRALEDERAECEHARVDMREPTCVQESMRACVDRPAWNSESAKSMWLPACTGRPLECECKRRSVCIQFRHVCGCVHQCPCMRACVQVAGHEACCEPGWSCVGQPRGN